jgi:hypothetical protein
VASIPACVTETVDQEFPARIEYLAAENRIMKAELKGWLKLRTPLGRRARWRWVAAKIGRW